MTNSGNAGIEATAAQSRKRRVKKRAASDLDCPNRESSFHAETMHGRGEESHMDEPTMAEKLAKLDLLDNEKAKSNGNEASLSTKIPSADSVHIMLKQALHAEDHALLLDCLYTRDEKVIAKTISLLSPADVLKLLNSLAPILQSRGAVLVCAVPWIRSLLGQHASSIMSQESSLLILNTLFQLIQSRISTFGLTLQLSSSLDYLFAGVLDDDDDGGAEESVHVPVFYEDEESDEEESGGTMETDEEDEELGAIINPNEFSFGGEVMSD